ncbi:MAG: LpxI family protein [Alphaproteobacteria bacterium]|nr:LpxI family protein [Alphaproteobacteria bacterium]
MPHTSNLPTLGIIAGDGRLPALLISACQRAHRPFFILAFEGSTDMDAIEGLPYALVRLGAIGEAMEHLRKAGVTQLVMAGKVSRPSLAMLRPDATAARLLTRIGAAFFSGDNALFKAIIAFLEEEGFHVIGSEDVLREIISPEGVLGNIEPNEQQRADIHMGIVAARALGEKDLGQAVIVHNGEVIGVEDSNGTDALIARCAFSGKAAGGVLVKVKKPFQETRVDLPAIGPQTILNCHKAGICGIAVEAGGSIIIDRDLTIAKADSLGLFLAGVRDDG